MYLNKPISEYLNDLAARKPAPGGGSAAALSGAIAAALMSMTANYTLGNKFKAVETKVADILFKVDRYRGDLEALIDRDVAAYTELSGAMKKYKKGTKELDEAFKAALTPPFEICKISAGCLTLCKTLAEVGNKNLITDTAIAAILLEGAFFAAKFNVYVNLKYIGDMSYVKMIHDHLSPLEKKMPALKEEIIEMCEEVISK